MTSREKIAVAAQKYIDRGQFDLAIKEYNKILAQNPHDLSAQLRIGYFHAQLGDREQAASIYLSVAHDYERRGGLARAARVLEQASRLQPWRVEIYQWLAEVLRKLDQPAESRRYLEVAYKLLLKKESFVDARRVLESMVVLDPGNVAILIRLGEAYAAEGLTGEAVDELSRAAEILRVAEWHDDFVRVAERITFLQPDNVEMNRELAILHLRRHDPRKALKALQRCYQVNQYDPEILNLLADAFIDLREPNKAVITLEALHEVYRSQGEVQRCQVVEERILELDPERTGPQVTGPDDQLVQNTVIALPPSGLHSVSQSRTVVLTTGDLDLLSLERTLKPSGIIGTPPSFVPAITAEHLKRDKHEATYKLDASDLEEALTEDPITEEMVRVDFGDIVYHHSSDEFELGELERLAGPLSPTDDLYLKELEKLEDRPRDVPAPGAVGFHEATTLVSRDTQPGPDQEEDTQVSPAPDTRLISGSKRKHRK